MNAWNVLLSGLTGAVAVTVMQECTRRTMAHPPRADLLGMRAIARMSRLAGAKPPDHLRRTALAGDLLANTAYYSIVGLVRPDRALAVGTIAGILAATGLLALPGPLHLGPSAVNRTRQTQFAGAGMYLAAGLIAGAAATAISRRAQASG
jgi:hypothetical protein